MEKEEKKKVLKVRLHTGKFYTITVSEMNDMFIQGVDLYGYPIKLLMRDIESVIPVHKLKW